MSPKRARAARAAAVAAAARALGGDERAEAVAEAVCDALSPWGAPSARDMREGLRTERRDADIRRRFVGRNCHHLARIHRLSQRQVRRIAARGGTP